MNKLSMITLLGLLLAVTPAVAQASPQTEMATTGKITAIDLQRGTLALDTGVQFTLAPTLQYTTAPAVNQEVQVTYSEQHGQKVAHIIDLAPPSNNKSLSVGRRR
jgi:hypothetical protein